MAEAELPDLQARREKLWDELLDRPSAAKTPTARVASWKSAREPAAKKPPCSPATCTKCTAIRRNQGLEGRNHGSQPHRTGRIQRYPLGLEGEGVFRELQYESGGHRVQRVPETEAKGRIHTSAATVAVMPEPEDVEIDLKPDDYRKDMFRASGPGGQHVNKTASASG